MKQEGIDFKVNTYVGRDISIKDLQNRFDAVVLAIGAESPRDLAVEGRDLKGIYFAMEYLSQQTKILY